MQTRTTLIERPDSSLRPHVVLLGAGTSRAAFPDGDATGKRLPLMNDLAQVLDLEPILERAGKFENQNFELIYSELDANPHHNSVREEIERQVREYFSSLELPETATIYDRILLSLRHDDAVFTFNWDPFLFDAYQRNRHVVALPEIFFLHGNVRIAKCPQHEYWGARYGRCPSCFKQFEDVALLYPVAEKGYSGRPYIAESWKAARKHLCNASMLTIFGYSAPDSDGDAVELLRSAWMERSERSLESVEVVDIICESDLHERWSRFTPTHHLLPRQCFGKSWLAIWPRRSREGVWAAMSRGIPSRYFPLTDTTNLVELQEQTMETARFENRDCVEAK